MEGIGCPLAAITAALSMVKTQSKTSSETLSLVTTSCGLSRAVGPITMAGGLQLLPVSSVLTAIQAASPPLACKVEKKNRFEDSSQLMWASPTAAPGKGVVLYASFPSLV